MMDGKAEVKEKMKKEAIMEMLKEKVKPDTKTDIAEAKVEEVKIDITEEKDEDAEDVPPVGA